MSRDVLAPPLMRMSGNRCYRVNLIHEDFGTTASKQQSQTENNLQQHSYTEPDMYTDDFDEEENSACTIEELANGSYKLAMHVPSAFYGGIIGFKGSTKRRIESETQTDINVPRNRLDISTEKKENIIIKGKSRDKILSARRQLNILTSSLRSRMRPTHFLGIALRSSDVQTKFAQFQQEVLALELPGIDELLFQSDNCIHITLGVCVLLDETERSKAMELLQANRELLTDLCTPFDIKVSGLEIMNDDPSSVRVLYACINAPNLQKFADRCMLPFKKAGFASDKQNREQVKLHMTVMNNRYRKKIDEKSDKDFDAREILKRFGNFDFGSAQCNEILLLALGQKKQKGEFYKVTGALKF